MIGIDVAVVGAGPAGLAAATTCASLGLDVTLFDEQPHVGGQIYRGLDEHRLARPERLGSEYLRGAALLQAFRASRARHVAGATVWFARRSGSAAIELGVSSQNGADASSSIVTARAMIVATGAQERAFPVAGWTLPGVMTAGAAQILLKTAGLVPQRGVVLAGCGPLLWLVASQILSAGGAIDALLETTPRRRLRQTLRHAPKFMASHYFGEGLRLARYVRRHTRVIEYVTALAAVGSKSLEAARFVVDGVPREVFAEQLLLHQGVIPRIDLAGAAGCALRWNEVHACFEPIVDDWGASTVASLWITGDGAGIAGAQAAVVRGQLTALAVAHALGRIDARLRDRMARRRRRELARAVRGRRFLDTLFRPADVFRLPAGDTLVCRCEEITARQVIDAARLGCQGPNQAKAFLRCGMGPCQGRFCGSTVSELIARERGLSPADVGHLRARSPVKPITLGDLASLPTNPVAEAAVVRERGTH